MRCKSSLYLTKGFTRKQLQEAIEKPAKLFDGKVEPALVNRLLNDMGFDSVRLPVLQHALIRMWHRATQEKTQPITLTFKHYQDIGGLKKALSKHANEAYEEFDSW
ncbi:MAG: hypothetical protein VSS75_028260 [Candidatus Parabeggiatoa sp.]|nr:hypothetical protein [Candidatus Parabeggiatoa sp.]